jgi:hypothetical protein
MTNPARLAASDNGRQPDRPSLDLPICVPVAALELEPWFRKAWAAGAHSNDSGIQALIENERFIAAAGVDSHMKCRILIPDVIPMSHMTKK